MKGKQILIVFIGINLLGLVAFLSIQHSYKKGFEAGKVSVVLNDLCKESKVVATGTDFQKGYGYDLVECRTNFRHWKEDWGCGTTGCPPIDNFINFEVRHGEEPHELTEEEKEAIREDYKQMRTQ